MSTVVNRAEARFAERRGSVAVVVLCMFLNMIDGFDLFIVGFALPHLPAGFATDGEKGLIISFALFGMAVGAIGLARFADRLGRRTIVLAGAATNLAGLCLSALAANAELLMGARFITGVGVGMISVVIVVVAQESAAPEKRNTATGIVMIGYPLGTTLAGFGSAAMLGLADDSWRMLFWLGAGLAIVGLVAAFACIPESAAFLARRAGAAVDAGPQATVEAAPRLMGRTLRVSTLLLCTGYALLSAAFYFIGTWTPQLITTATGDQGTGATAGIVIACGTLAGAVLFAVLGLRLAPLRMAPLFSVVTIVSLAGFAILLPSLTAYAFAAVLGVSVFAAMACYTALIPTAYPVLARAGGYGAMLGFGRVGAILAPSLAGFALAVVTPTELYLLTAVPLAAAGLTSIGLARVLSSKVKAPSLVQAPVHATAGTA